MIAKVTGKNFKGLTFEQSLSRLNLFIGPNGSGKSARTQALILGIMGYIPGGAKKNPEILETYGMGDVMSVGFEASEIPGGAVPVLFERGFVRSDAGTVSQTYRIDGAPTKESNFLKVMALRGNPAVVDISAFMELSDQKKIDAVFALYPPAGDVAKTQQEIDAIKAKISNLAEKAKSAEIAAARLVSSKPSLPAGSLADIAGKITAVEQELATARFDLSEAKMAEATRAATERAEKKAAEDAKKLAERQALEKIEAAAAALATADRAREKEIAARDAAKALPGGEVKGPMETLVNKTFGPEGTGKYPVPEESFTYLHPGGRVEHKMVASIQVIIDTMYKAGCKSCAARLVALRELKKYREVT